MCYLREMSPGLRQNAGAKADTTPLCIAVVALHVCSLTGGGLGVPWQQKERT